MKVLLPGSGACSDCAVLLLHDVGLHDFQGLGLEVRVWLLLRDYTLDGIRLGQIVVTGSAGFCRRFAMTDPSSLSLLE